MQISRLTWRRGCDGAEPHVSKHLVRLPALSCRRWPWPGALLLVASAASASTGQPADIWKLANLAIFSAAMGFGLLASVMLAALHFRLVPRHGTSDQLLQRIDTSSQSTTRGGAPNPEGQVQQVLAQFQPGFVSDTLEQVDRWLMAGNTGTGPLLRALTAYLRAASEHQQAARVTMEMEVALVRKYLAVQAARSGDELDLVEPAESVMKFDITRGELVAATRRALEVAAASAPRTGLIEVPVAAGDVQLLLRLRPAARHR